MTAIDERIAAGDIHYCKNARCGRPVFYAETPSGRGGIIDAEPAAFGEYVLLAWRISRERGPAYLLGRPIVDAEPDEPRFASHHRTCRKKG